MQGVGRRYANLVCKKADVDMNKRAGELTDDEVKLHCHRVFRLKKKKK